MPWILHCHDVCFYGKELAVIPTLGPSCEKFVLYFCFCMHIQAATKVLIKVHVWFIHPYFYVFNCFDKQALKAGLYLQTTLFLLNFAIYQEPYFASIKLRYFERKLELECIKARDFFSIILQYAKLWLQNCNNIINMIVMIELGSRGQFGQRVWCSGS